MLRMDNLEEETLELKLVVVVRKPIKHLGWEALGLKVDDKEEAGLGLESLEMEAILDHRALAERESKRGKETKPMWGLVED